MFPGNSTTFVAWDAEPDAEPIVVLIRADVQTTKDKLCRGNALSPDRERELEREVSSIPACFIVLMVLIFSLISSTPCFRIYHLDL